MSRAIAVCISALFLWGCGFHQASPLTHAIAALRAGDKADFDAAKAEGQNALQSAWQQGMDICKITIFDLQKYGEAALIDRLDHPELFKLSEEARFAYTAKVVGKLNAAYDELADQPISQNYPFNSRFRNTDTFEVPTCLPDYGGVSAAFREGLPGETARRAVLKDWLADLQERHGETQFDAAMNNAVAELDNNGFSADWPAPLQLKDDPNMPTFRQTQNQ
jgi:hypothetical protein